uniref:Cyclin T2a n=1 Tax=Oncorhynchus mykiss TaxID=8022 RepID=A0A8C7RLB2_ONCMY
MAACRGSSSKWFFTREQLEATPSRRTGVEPDRELSYRQQAANLIQDMGQRLNVSQLTINTAIVYMHRFYMYHSFTKFHRNIISPTTLFLAAKVEEQPRKLEHVIKVSHACLNPQEAPLDTKSNAYLQQAQELVILETIVLQTLGFEITIEHPHTDVVKCSQLVRASKDLAQTSYFMATNSLHLTTFCLQHKPTVIACVCIHLACKWSNWEIPVSTDGKHWWEYVDNSVTLELLDELTHDFLQILEKTPSRLKRIRNWRATQAAKKPKGDGSQANDPYPGPSLVHEHSLGDGIPGVSNSAFSKAASSFPVPLPGHASGPLSLDSIASMQGSSYTFTHGSLNPHRPDKTMEFNPIKHEHKAVAGGGKQQQQQPPPAQKMSLDKYREKHAAELAVQQKRKQTEQQAMEPEGRDAYIPSVQSDHRKHMQPHSNPGSSSSGTTSSPLKMKLAVLGQDRLPSDKRDKGGSLKLRLPVPSQGGMASKEELKMKIKVSSERHSSSDEGGPKSKHSSPLVSKEKHRDQSAHRHHKQHGHSQLHAAQHSGNGRGGLEGPAGVGPALLRSPLGLGNVEGLAGPALASVSSSSRKRAHPNVAGHNHHSSKTSKSSKGGAGSSSHWSGFPPVQTLQTVPTTWHVVRGHAICTTIFWGRGDLQDDLKLDAKGCASQQKQTKDTRTVNTSAIVYMPNLCCEVHLHKMVA